MNAMYQRIILADVDGTVIDRDGRPFGLWDSVREALSDFLIVLVSSRTVHEVVLAQQVLDLAGPFVAENGAIVAVPSESPDVSSIESNRLGRRHFLTTPLGIARRELLGVLRGAAISSDLALEDESAAPDELETVPRKARGRVIVHRDQSPRTHSLRLTVDCAPNKRQQLIATLAGASIGVSNGGRWDVLHGRSDKGLGARALLRQLGRGGASTVVAIGDAENDLPMFDVADHRIVMRRPDGSVHPALSEVPGAFVPATAGVAGWTDVLPYLRAQMGGDMAYV